MTLFTINQGPYQRGLKPRGFFVQRKRMIQLSAMTKSGDLEFSDEFGIRGKKVADVTVSDPSTKSFYEILPWTLFVGMTLSSIILL